MLMRELMKFLARSTYVVVDIRVSRFRGAIVAHAFGRKAHSCWKKFRRGGCAYGRYVGCGVVEDGIVDCLLLRN